MQIFCSTAMRAQQRVYKCKERVSCIFLLLPFAFFILLCLPMSRAYITLLEVKYFLQRYEMILFLARKEEVKI